MNPLPHLELRPALRRLDGVDTLRGLSIVAVILLHIYIRFSFFGVNLGAAWPKLIRHFVFFNGGNGVTTFFAVSGFLITLTSLRRFGSLGALRPAVFYRIRFARIMPLLVLLLVVLSALHLMHIEGFRINEKVFSLTRALLSALTFHLNWLETSRNAYLPACWTVLWSLSIEEMFYVLFPIACWMLLRRGRWQGMGLWVATALLLIAVGPFARAVWAQTDLAAENSYLAGMATIALGCLTALATETLSRSETLPERTLGAMQGAGWAILLLIALWPRWQALRWLGRSGLDDTLLGLGVCLILLATTLRNRRGLPWTGPLRWAGRHSYELYLFHEFVILGGIDGLFARSHAHGASRAVVGSYVVAMVLVSMVLGWALARWFSEPANRRLRGARTAR